MFTWEQKIQMPNLLIEDNMPKLIEYNYVQVDSNISSLVLDLILIQ